MSDKIIRVQSPLAEHFIDRRTFLASAAALAGASIVGGVPRSALAKDSMTAGMERLAVTMWDFSWLTRRTPPENEYADFDKALDDLCARGYDCVRIDAFPHLVATGLDNEIHDRFLMLAQRPAFMWGNHSDVEIEPRKGLIEFMRKCRDRGIRVGLSSWFQKDKTGRVNMINTPQDFTRVWQETLDLIESEDMLDSVEWVDLCNEFPLAVWAPGAAAYMKKESGRSFELGVYNTRQKDVLSRFMAKSIEPLKKRFPGLRFCFSFSLPNPKSIEGVDFSCFGLFEPHLWLNMNPAFSVLSGLWATLVGVPKATYLASLSSATYFRAFKKQWLGWLEDRIDAWCRFAGKWGLPLYTTEAWGPINYEDLPAWRADGEWKWVREISEQAVDMAIVRGWKGICTSNFCGPQHEGMWKDIQWHKKMTDAIRGKYDLTVNE